MTNTAIFGLAGVLLMSLAVAISIVDLRWLRIPDGLNAALAVGGVGFQVAAWQAFPLWSVFGAIGLGLAFFVVRQIHQHHRGEVGLGLGDVKMAGASALWLHPANLPVFVFLASVAALVSVLIFGRSDENYQATGRLPFGPFLALGLVVTWCLENFVGVGFLTD